MKNVNNMMKHAQQMQSKILDVQRDLATKKIEASVGGGMVKVSSSGDQKILSVKINKEVVNPNDIEMLEELIVVAINDALNKSKEMASKAMNKVTGKIKIPGMF